MELGAFIMTKDSQSPCAQEAQSSEGETKLIDEHKNKISSEIAKCFRK